jgi:hypothetical protein
MAKERFLTICALAFLGWPMAGQTRIDLKNQTRAVDFSGATYTKPAKSGTSLPVTCGAGEMYILTSGPAGSNVYVCTATNTWNLQGGESSSGALNTLAVSRTSGTVLTIGTDCSVSAPCNVRTGGSTLSFANSSTATISAGTGTAYVYVSSAGQLTVGHNVTLTCTGGCAAQSGITAFPAGSVPLAVWTATSGVWSDSGSDLRSFVSRDYLTTGAGLTMVSGPGYQSISVDQAAIGLRSAAPASTGATCTVGQWALDASHYYLCVAANSWKRAALASW